MAICHCEQSGGYFPLIVLRCIVASRYYELGYLEPLAISNTLRSPLVLIYIFQYFTIVYLNLGYLEPLAISNSLWFPLVLIYIFQYFTIVYLNLGYPESPAISNTFSFPLIQINLLYEIYILDYKHIFIIY